MRLLLIVKLEALNHYCHSFPNIVLLVLMYTIHVLDSTLGYSYGVVVQFTPSSTVRVIPNTKTNFENLTKASRKII